jgi:hypothetical protein
MLPQEAAGAACQAGRLTVAGWPGRPAGSAGVRALHRRLQSPLPVQATPDQATAAQMRALFGHLRPPGSRRASRQHGAHWQVSASVSSICRLAIARARARGAAAGPEQMRSNPDRVIDRANRPRALRCAGQICIIAQLTRIDADDIHHNWLNSNLLATPPARQQPAADRSQEGTPLSARQGLLFSGRGTVGGRREGSVERKRKRKRRHRHHRNAATHQTVNQIG